MARKDTFYDRGRPAPLAARILGAAVALAVLLALVRVALPDLLPLRPRSEVTRDVDEALDEVFTAEGVDRETISGRPSSGEGDPAEVRAAVPADRSLTGMNAEIARAMEGKGATVRDAVEAGPFPENPSALKLELGTADHVTHRVTLEPEPGSREGAGVPRLAIVFDDLGWSMDELVRELLELPAPLTFAVLPDLAYSEAFAEAARARGHEVILHLPMEPIDPVRHDPGEGAVLVALSPEENRRRVRACLDGLSAYSGVSNHMGSRVTADAELVDLVLGEIRGRDRKLFFLDSMTTPYSVVGKRARQAGVPSLSNNLFLDAGEEGEKLAFQRAERLSGIARRRGHAIAIGHVRRETISAIRHAIPEWQEEGIELVRLSDLMHR
jgi:polysaccharide deacetylase 2 family uncharacterized protein YibQ